MGVLFTGVFSEGLAGLCTARTENAPRRATFLRERDSVARLVAPAR